MSSDLLFELPGKVIKTFALTQTSGGVFHKSALVIVQTDSISVAHGENGSLYHQYNFGRRTALGNIVDCVFLHEKRTFVVAFADSSLVSVPIDCKDVSLCTQHMWPKQPKQLVTSDGRTVSVFCEGGYICTLTLTATGDIPQPPSSWDERSINAKDNVIMTGNNKYITTVATSTTSSSTITSSTSPSGKKKGKQSKDTENTDVPKVIVSFWTLPLLLEGSITALTAENAVNVTMNVQDDEVVCTAVCHSSVDSLSVLLTKSNTTSSTARWVKLSMNGGILFERHLSLVLPIVRTAEAGEHLAVLTSDRLLRFYDSRYGTEVRSVTLNDATSTSPITASWLVSYTTDSTTTAKSTPSGSLQLITSKALQTQGPTNIYHRTLATTTPTTSSLTSSLCHSIGKLSASKNTSCITESGTVATLSTDNKRKLKEACAQYVQYVATEKAVEVAEFEDITVRQEFKRQKLNITVPQQTSEAFLRDCENRCQAAIKASTAVELETWEWEALQLLARTGGLSITKNASLLSAAAKACRFDVLATLVEYATDLTERQCVQIFAHFMLAPASDLEKVTVSESGVISTTTSSSANTSKTLESAKKVKKNSKNTTVPEQNSDGESRRFDLLRCVVLASLRRSSAFSAILLGEAVRLLSLPTAVVLLRILSYFLQTLSEHGAQIDNISVADEQLKRAATWVEALLDGHFSGLALHAIGHASTRRALMQAMNAVTGAAEAAEHVQGALGLWTHISRVVHNGGQQVKPITSLYQVEQLDLR